MRSILLTLEILYFEKQQQVRYLIYSKNLESKIDIVHPQELGGLKSPEYLALNPQGKMPLLLLPSGEAFPESDTISRFILDEFRSSGPSFDPCSSLLRAKSDLAARILDIYITPNQGALYKAMSAEERSKGIGEIAFQLDVLESILSDEGGARVCGSEKSLADSALFPTLCFLVDILPAIFGWSLDGDEKGALWRGRAKLRSHWEEMSEKDEVGKRVIAEMRSGLKGWFDNKRWDELGITAQIKEDPSAFVF